ncbi:hypothetical protein [Ammoniphilus sp. 3BR4]|uniref:hypothetical protein n=1 Tax=Ammoniphilus sp. 3BR4 TaxID=3158265 RepID=UPI003465C62C
MRNIYLKEIQLPDILFCKLCEDKYGINRGVYNSIDTWFFQKGMENWSAGALL